MITFQMFTLLLCPFAYIGNDPTIPVDKWSHSPLAIQEFLCCVPSCLPSLHTSPGLSWVNIESFHKLEPSISAFQTMAQDV